MPNPGKTAPPFLIWLEPLLPTLKCPIACLCVLAGLLFNPPQAVAQSFTRDGFQLESTVGLDSQTCAPTPSLSLPAGRYEVIVCLTATNGERNDLLLHDLLSEQLGVLATDLHYTLRPGDSVFYTFPLHLDSNTAITSAWLARGANGQLACKVAWSVVTIGGAMFTADRNTSLICP